MKKYTKLYMNHFNYGIDDFIPCEICGSRSTEIHHIHARSQRKDLLNDITNCIAICRSCHIKFGDKKQYLDYLKDVHNKVLESNLTTKQ